MIKVELKGQLDLKIDKVKAQLYLFKDNTVF